MSRYNFFLLFLLVFLPIACNPERTLFNKGWEEENQGRLSEAIYYYELSLKENPDFKEAHRRIGSLLAQNPESWGVAIWHLEQALKQDPKDKDLRLELSLLYLANEKWIDFDKQLAFWNTNGEKEIFTGLTALHNCETKSGKLQPFADAIRELDFIPEIWKSRCNSKLSNR